MMRRTWLQRLPLLAAALAPLLRPTATRAQGSAPAQGRRAAQGRGPARRRPGAQGPLAAHTGTG